MTKKTPFIDLRLWKQHYHPDQVAELFQILKKVFGKAEKISTLPFRQWHRGP